MEGRKTSFLLSEFGVKQLGTKTMISSEMATPTKLLQFVPCQSVMAGAASAGLPGLMTMVTLVPDATKLYQTSSAGAG